MVHENSRPSESSLCRLCAARFDDGKCCAVLSAATKCQSPAQVSSGVIFPVLLCFLSSEHGSVTLMFDIVSLAGVLPALATSIRRF